MSSVVAVRVGYGGGSQHGGHNLQVAAMIARVVGLTRAPQRAQFVSSCIRSSSCPSGPALQVNRPASG